MNDVDSIITDTLNITIFSVGEFSENDLVKSVAGKIGDVVLAQSDITNLVSDLSSINSEIDGKADAAHTHDDRYYTETEANALLANKSDVSHTHDDRYFTESEVTALLAGKSNVGHGHGIADVTSLQAILDNKAQKQFAIYDSDLGLNFFGYRVALVTLTANQTFNVVNLPAYEMCYIYVYNAGASAITITKQSGYISTNWGNTNEMTAGTYATFMLYTDGTNKYITKIG